MFETISGHRLRILYLVPDLFGPPSGIARYCRMVCRALLEAGHQVSVISLHDQAVARREAKASLPALRYIACESNRARFVHRAMRALQARPDLVLVGHAHFAHLGWLLAQLGKARLISFIYGIEVWEPLSRARRAALNASQSLVSISQFTARRASEVNGIPLSKVRVLHNCLDPKFEGLSFEGPSSALDDPALVASHSNAAVSRVPSLLTVARITLREQYKGHDVVIRALPALLRRFPNLTYHVVGDGDGRVTLENLAREQGVAGNVWFHGVVSEAQLMEAYREATVFVMPSRFEGFGFVFLEAMTYGKPVVAGNQDASPEVVADGRVGFTVDPTSAEAVESALCRLLDDPALCARMGREAARSVAENFGFPRFKEQLLMLLLPSSEATTHGLEATLHK